MPVSGLVLTLGDAPGAALDALRTHPEIELGERFAAKQPIVVDTQTRARDREVWDWLRALPGVLHVDVACIHFDPPEQGRSGGNTRVP